MIVSINSHRAYSMFPDLKIFAVGVGKDITQENLDVIAGDRKRTFTVEGIFEFFLNFVEFLTIHLENSFYFLFNFSH